jgi:predicted lipid-binding transport protein (Tim44 family)
MKTITRISVAGLVSLQLVFTTGCVNPDGTPNNTASGALFGGAVGALTGAAVGGYRHGGQDALIGAAIGAVAGAIAGNVMDHINAQQQERLRQSSPQTLQTIQHNDQVVQQQQQQQQPQQAATPAAAGQAAPSGEAPTPLKVDDIKALTAAGVKPQAIIQAIKESKPAAYSAADIQAAQQANPPVDQSVIACMQNPTA